MSDLLERAPELGIIDSLLEGARGSGQLLVIEGAAGVGKTSLLEAALRRAEALGLGVAVARGADFERDIGFGVARQLLERQVRETEGRERERVFQGAAGLARPLLEPAADAMPVDTQAALHGLYWLLCELAAARPLVLAIDDAHWSDPESLRWIPYVLRRGDGVPVTFVLTARRAQAQRDPLLAELGGLPGGRSVELGPLTDRGVSDLIGRELGTEPAPAFAAECHRLTAGNPFSLHELVLELRAGGIAPTAEALAALDTTVPGRLRRMVLLRTGRLGSDAVALARAVAILGDGVPVAIAAKLAGLDPTAGELISDRLSEADVLASERPLRFTHPLLRTAVYEDIALGERRLAHGRAAALLHALDLDPERIAAQILLAESAAEPWATEALRAGARRAMGRGSPRAAAAFLRRAVADAAAEHATGELRLELARAVYGSGDPDTAGLLGAAAAACSDPSDRATAHWMLGALSLFVGAMPAALEEYERAALEGAGGPDAGFAAALEADWLAVAQMEGADPPARAIDRLAQLDRELPPGSDGQRMLLAVVAYDRMKRGVEVGQIVEPATRALAGDPMPLLGQSVSLYLGALALIYADRPELTEGRLEQEVTIATAAGQPVALAVALTVRVEAEHRCGRLREAEADALAVLELGSAPAIVAAMMTPFLDTVLERSGVKAAEEILAGSGQLDVPPGELWPSSAAFARGLLRVAQRRWVDALADFAATGRMLERTGSTNPATFSWRSQSALALRGLDRTDEALALVAEELALARRFGAPRAIGIALRVKGQLEPGATGIESLEQAVEVLGASTAALEHARARFELGAALRRAGRRTDARARLREAARAAERVGARSLFARAHDELAASGARRRRPELGVRDTLTPAELRVARLAAGTMTNREIAQALFLSLKTVEMHLGRSYRKLGITSRTDLGRALADTAGGQTG